MAIEPQLLGGCGYCSAYFVEKNICRINIFLMGGADKLGPFILFILIF